jgi:phosphoribosylanthranilate isomerase
VKGLPPHGAVKVCGITGARDARVALEAGAHFLGLVFAESPRRVEPEGVKVWMKDIRREFPASLWVGVFLPEDSKRIGPIASDLSLDLVQFHGRPVPSALYGMTQPVLAGIRLGSQGEVSPSVEPEAWALLVDTYDPARQGGTGRTFPWEWVSGWSEQRRIFLSGGLGPRNVSEAIEAVSPYGVDASSGLETEPGRKDPQKLRDYIEAALRAFRRREGDARTKKEP